jgi:hypothetical protein
MIYLGGRETASTETFHISGHYTITQLEAENRELALSNSMGFPLREDAIFVYSTGRHL